MGTKIIEVIKVGNEISALVEVNGESVWSAGSHITECVSEARFYVGMPEDEAMDSVIIHAVIKAFKTEVERKINEGFTYWNDVLELIK